MSGRTPPWWSPRGPGSPCASVSAATGQPATFRKVALPAPVGPAGVGGHPGGHRPRAAPSGWSPPAASSTASASGPRRCASSTGRAGLAGIASVAVAPDGHRVAVIAGGRLYLSVLTAADNGMQLSPPLPVRTLMRELTAVDWSSEGSLVVAGVRTDKDRVAITDVSIDGAVQTYRQPDLGTARITHLVAYPANPVINTGDANAVAYVADDVAYNVLSAPEADRRRRRGRAGAQPGGRAVLPTAPFFLN